MLQRPNNVTNPNARYLYTTDAPGLQSNLEASDLAELMDLVLPLLPQLPLSARCTTPYSDVTGTHSRSSTKSRLAEQAQLAERDFTAERGVPIVISNGTVAPLDRERSLQERKDAEERNSHRQDFSVSEPFCPAR